MNPRDVQARAVLHPSQTISIPARWNRQPQRGRGRGLSRGEGSGGIKSSPSSAFSSSSCADRALGHPRRLTRQPLRPTSTPGCRCAAVPLHGAWSSLCPLTTTRQELMQHPGKKSCLLTEESGTDQCWNC